MTLVVTTLSAQSPSTRSECGVDVDFPPAPPAVRCPLCKARRPVAVLDVVLHRQPGKPPRRVRRAADGSASVATLRTRTTTSWGVEDGAPLHVGRRLRRLTSYQASPRLVVTGSSTLVGNPDDVPPAAYSGEWVPGPARGAPTGVGGISLPFRPWPAGGP